MTSTFDLQTLKLPRDKSA